MQPSTGRTVASLKMQENILVLIMKNCIGFFIINICARKSEINFTFSGVYAIFLLNSQNFTIKGLR